MKCELAQRVWAHPAGPIEGLREHLPQALERLSNLAHRFVLGEQDPFDQQVKQMVGWGPFIVVHADDNDSVAEDVHSVVGDAAMQVVLSRHFTEMYHKPVAFGNVCCSGCIAQDGTLDSDRLIAIQRAAISLQ